MKKRGRDNTTRVSAFWKGEKAIATPHCACVVRAVVVDLLFPGDGGVYNTLCRPSCAGPWMGAESYPASDTALYYRTIVLPFPHYYYPQRSP